MKRPYLTFAFFNALKIALGELLQEDVRAGAQGRWEALWEVAGRRNASVSRIKRRPCANVRR